MFPYKLYCIFHALSRIAVIETGNTSHTEKKMHFFTKVISHFMKCEQFLIKHEKKLTFTALQKILCEKQLTTCKIDCTLSSVEGNKFHTKFMFPHNNNVIVLAGLPSSALVYYFKLYKDYMWRFVCNSLMQNKRN